MSLSRSPSRNSINFVNTFANTFNNSNSPRSPYANWKTGGLSRNIMITNIDLKNIPSPPSLHRCYEVAHEELIWCKDSNKYNKDNANKKDNTNKSDTQKDNNDQYNKFE